MDLPPPAPISAALRRFLEVPNYATLATIGADGEPHQAMIWYRLEPDDRILVNSRMGRRWPTELRAAPRCSLAVFEVGDPYRWVGLQGVVESVVDDVETGRDDIVALAHRYDDASPTTIAGFRSQTRVSFRIRVVSIHEHLDD